MSSYLGEKTKIGSLVRVLHSWLSIAVSLAALTTLPPRRNAAVAVEKIEGDDCATPGKSGGSVGRKLVASR